VRFCVLGAWEDSDVGNNKKNSNGKINFLIFYYFYDRLTINHE